MVFATQGKAECIVHFSNVTDSFQTAVTCSVHQQALMLG